MGALVYSNASYIFKKIVKFFGNVYKEILDYKSYWRFKLSWGIIILFFSLIVCHTHKSQSMYLFGICPSMIDFLSKDTCTNISNSKEWQKIANMIGVVVEGGKYKIELYDENEELKHILLFYSGKISEVKDIEILNAFDVGKIEMHPSHVHIIYPYSEYFVRVILYTFYLCIILFVILCFFITKDKEKTKTIMEMQENKRFRSLVHLTAGIAHNFRNDLSVLVGQLKLLKKESMAKLPDRPYTRKKTIERIEIMEPILTNMAESITKIRRFTLEDRSENGNVDVIGVIRNTLEMFDQTIDKNITLKLRCNYEYVKCKAKKQNLSTVFLNILNNAYDAMDNTNKDKTIMVATDIIKENDDIRLSIRFKDNGIGMSEETKIMAFIPFYTADKASGTGLGLSTSRSLIEQVGGRMEIAFSARGEGTIILVELPVIDYKEIQNINTIEILKG